MPCCGRSPPLVAHRLPGSGERVPGRARVHCALSRGLRALPLALQVCRIRTSSRTSGRRAASSRRPVVSVPRVATRRERSALPLLCLCCSRASAVESWQSMCCTTSSRIDTVRRPDRQHELPQARCAADVRYAAAAAPMLPPYCLRFFFIQVRYEWPAPAPYLRTLAAIIAPMSWFGASSSGANGRGGFRRKAR